MTESPLSPASSWNLKRPPAWNLKKPFASESLSLGSSWKLKTPPASELACATQSVAQLMTAELAEMLKSSPCAAETAPPPLFCVGVDDDPVMLGLLESTLEQLGAASIRVLGETVAEQREAIELILGETGQASPALVAVLDQNLHNREGLPPLFGIDLASELRSRGFAGLIVLHTGASAHEVRLLERSPAIDAVVAKGVGKPLLVQLQQLINTRLALDPSHLGRTL